MLTVLGLEYGLYQMICSGDKFPDISSIMILELVLEASAVV